MVYTPEEQKMLDSILTAFDSYISGHELFDLVYSEKFGYVWLHVEECGSGMSVIHTVDKLLEVLFDEVADDVRCASGAEHFTGGLTEGERAETRRRLTQILNTIGPDAGFYLGCMDRYLNALSKEPS